MNVHPAKPESHELMRLNECKNLDVFSLWRRWKFRQKTQDEGALKEMPTGEFANHVGMSEDISLFQQGAKTFIPSSEMIDPDRRIHQDH